MNISLKWLRDYVDLALPPTELAERLTMAGVEVKGMQVVGGSWENIGVGEIVAIDTHPNADRLKLVTVNIGGQNTIVVSGAPNLRAGDKVAFASLGAQLIDGHTGEVIQLRPVKIRGIISEGMVCSEKELGISDSHEGIMILPPEAPVGSKLSDYLGDVIFDLDITPNRPDCLSVIGIAREVAALTEQTLHIPEIYYEELEAPINSFASVEIIEPLLCPRYCASLITGVKMAPSPQWLQRRLLASGMRPINNVVDITNYVMLEYGQPLHAFDYDKIEGKQIIVRRAKYGETITTLDGSERILSQDMLVIADRKRAVAIAGIMGGLGTEVEPETNTILIESANFNQAIIRRACNHLRLRTEASLRFEKGLSPELPLPALKRATQLILELAGGRSAKGIIDVYPGKLEKKPIPISIAQVQRLLGIEVEVDDMVKPLKLLGFHCEQTDSPSAVLVTVPYWRSDISLTADLVEEIARIIGYDRIPVTMLSESLPTREPTPKQALREEVRDSLVSCGFQEVLTYSLTSLDALKKLSPELSLIGSSPLKVTNPMTTEQEYLRTTLRCNLLAVLARNQKYEAGGIRLFEIGKVFLPQEKDLPREVEMLCAVLCGQRQELSWRSKGEFIDFFDAKGVVESVLSRLGVRSKFEASGDESLRPGRSASLTINGNRIGVVGELHPKVAQVFELSNTTYLIEIDLEKLLPLVNRVKKYEPLPRFPSTIRDIALVVSEEITFQQVKDIIQSFPLVSQATLFDLYHGEQVPAGKKSLAFRIVYQAPNRTLTDDEVNSVQQQILDKLYQELGATLR